MSNKTFLKDGTNFVVNPDKEDDPIAARKEKVRFVTGLNVLDMAKNPLWNVSAVREVATGLIPVMKDGKRLSKTELLEKLGEFIKAEREANLQTLDLFIGDKDLDTILLDDVWAALSKQVEPKDLALYIVKKLSQTYVTDKSLVKTAIPNLLKALKKDPRHLEHLIAIERVRDAIYSDPEIKAKQDAINYQYTQEVKENQGERQVIQVAPVLDYIKLALSTRNWQDLTYAIALATGRRMAEILGNHSTWVDNGDGTLTFTGLLKGKNRLLDGKPLIEASVILYPIVSPALIVGAIEKLELLGKKDSPHERVNTLYGKAFSNRPTGDMIRVRAESGLSKEFKASRDFYAAYQAKYEYKEAEMAETEEHFVMGRLHHDDLKTTASYRKLKLV